jgi:methylisocitrate lyase
MRPTRRLRDLLDHKDILVAPGAYDALTARLIQKAGFDAVYMTGAGIAHSTLGKPDVGLLSLSEMVERAARLADAVEVPVIADADTGYGNAINVIRTVREFEQAGVAAIQLEDQALPKRCGHLRGKELIPVEEMAGKLRAAAWARTDPDLVIVARTDARAVLGIEEAIRRAKAYAEAGADVLFVEAPESVEELKMIATSLDRPCLANMVEGGRTPLVPAAELQELGYKLVIFPGMLARFIARQVADFLHAVRREGTSQPFLNRMLTFDELNLLVGIREFRDLEARFLPGR